MSPLIAFGDFTQFTSPLTFGIVLVAIVIIISKIGNSQRGGWRNGHCRMTFRREGIKCFRSDWMI
jgi:hypothetical protein